MVNFETTVVRFKPNAMRDRFPGGGFASYDASELRIESPPERRGQTLLIYHHHSPPEEVVCGGKQAESCASASGKKI